MEPIDDLELNVRRSVVAAMYSSGGLGAIVSSLVSCREAYGVPRLVEFLGLFFASQVVVIPVYSALYYLMGRKGRFPHEEPTSVMIPLIVGGGMAAVGTLVADHCSENNKGLLPAACCGALANLILWGIRKLVLEGALEQPPVHCES